MKMLPKMFARIHVCHQADNVHPQGVKDKDKDRYYKLKIKIF